LTADEELYVEGVIVKALTSHIVMKTGGGYGARLDPRKSFKTLATERELL
jgi:hypothetical protein